METTQPLPDRSAYPSLPTDAISYDEFLRRNTATGTLKVQASRAQGALPTAGVRISVITPKRAYDELERSGFIYTIPGKGSFVSAKNTELMREEHLKQMEAHMTAVRSLAQLTGLSREEVQEMWNLMWEESE